MRGEEKRAEKKNKENSIKKMKVSGEIRSENEKLRKMRRTTRG